MNKWELMLLYMHGGIVYYRSCGYTNFVLWYYIQLSKEVQRSLENYRKQNPDTITFEIYTYFQQLVEVTKNAEDE